MRVNSYYSSVDGSSFYRLELPAKTLKAQGMDIGYYKTGTDAPDCDVVIINRPVNQIAVDAVRELTNAGYAVIVDMDDNFRTIRSNHAMFPKAAEYHQYALQACKEATLVTCATQANLEEYGCGHGVVIPNYIPEWYLSIEPKPHDGMWVGWSGTVNSHPNDLQQTKGRVAKAVIENGADIAYVGPKDQAHEVRDALKYKRPMKVAGWFRMEDFPKAVAEFDIGVVPLELSIFNDCKSWLKGLELAAVGVPFVASPTQQYRELVALGCGNTALHARDWHSTIGTLLKSSQARSQGAGMGRQVAALLTIERNADRWASAIEWAYLQRR